MYLVFFSHISVGDTNPLLKIILPLPEGSGDALFKDSSYYTL